MNSAKAFPTHIGVTTPLKSTPPKGKTIVFLQCEEVTCPQQGIGIQAATTALGWSFKTLNFNDTQPATLVSALQQALQYNPVAVMFAGQPEAVWSSVLPAYQKAGALIIPDAPGQATVDDVVPAITQGNDWSTRQGKILADFVATDSQGKANILFEQLPSYSTFVPLASSFKSELSTVCPACSVTDLENTLPDLFAGKIDADIVTAVRKDSSINYIVSVDGNFITGLTSSLTTAGLGGKYHIASTSGGTPDWQNIAIGTETETTASGFLYTGWLSVDVALRHMQGLPIPSGDTVDNTIILLTKDNVPTPAESLDLPADYATQFKTLWKLG